jgi:hypothetical protein
MLGTDPSGQQQHSEIFISYKSERRPAAEHLAKILRLNGYSVWFDDSLIKGRDFALQIDQHIRAARALIALWCPLSVDAHWVHEEVDLAEKLDILVPVKIEPCELKVGDRRSYGPKLARSGIHPGGQSSGGVHFLPGCTGLCLMAEDSDRAGLPAAN